MGEIGSGSFEGLGLVEESGPETQTGTENCSRIGRDDKGVDEVDCQMSDVGIVVFEHLLDDSKAVKTGYTGDNSLGAGMMLSASPNGNVASLYVENDNGTGECIGSVHGFEGEEKMGTLVTELVSTVEIPSAAMNNDGCDFPCLSPLRTLRGDELGNSLCMDATLGICGTNLCADDRDCKECEDSTDRPPELVTDHALVNEQADIFLPVSAVSSTTFETGWMDGRCKGTILFESKHPSFKMNGTDLVDSIEENQLFCMDNSGVVLSNNSAAVEEQKVAGACSLACEFYATTQKVYKEEIHTVSESCSLTCEQSDKAVPCSAEEEFASQCLSTLADYHAFEQFTRCDTSKDDGVAVGCSRALSSSVGVSCDQSDNSRTGNVKADPILFYRRSNPKRAASLRNTSSVSKPNQSASTKHVRKSKKVVKDSTTLSNINFWNSLKMASRKKSSHRMGRASVWGTVENLYAMFSHTDGVSNCNTELNLTKRETRKARCSTGRRRQSKSQKGGREKGVSCAATKDSLELIEHGTPQFILPTSHVFTSTCPTECLPLNNTQTKTDFSVDGCSPMQFPHHHGNLEDPATSLERDVRHGEKDLESSVTQETSFENNTGDLPGVSSQLGYEALVELSDDKLVNYPSTSPESDVIHPTTDVGIIISDFVTSTSRTSSNTLSTTQNDRIPNSIVQDNSHPDVYNVSNVTMFVPSPGLQQCAKHKNEQTIRIQESSCPLSGFSNQEKKADDLVCQYKARKPARCCKAEKKVRPGSDRQNPCNGKGRRKSSKKGLHQMEFLAEKPSLGEAELLCHGETLNVQSDEKKLVSTEKDAEIDVASKVTIAGEGKCTPALMASSSTKKGAEGRKKKGTNSFTKKKTKKKELLGHLVVEKEGEVLASCLEENGAPTLHLESGDAYPLSGMAEPNDLDLSRNNMLGDLGGNGGGSEIPSQKPLNSGIALPRDAEVLENSLGFENECLPPEVGWVCCDVCNKWRSLPSKLVDIIKETNCKWTCKDNNDKAFADCLIPQEKTNAEINAELEISDVSGEDNFHSAQPNSKRSDPAKRSATKQSSWKRIKSNLFLHRNRKTQNIDEVMVCFCKPPSDGSLGCGDGCLNRMLNIECVRGTCPCGDLCSNQQFQKRKYAKLKWFPCGKKGYGLQLLEKVSEGEFLIEYVGEVLDMATYEARQKDYASRGQRHFYFMTLNGSEVIDACVKGNLGRFINHSCEPNCRTEKWMVNGEICIGLFAIRDIKKGEELTFDYNYVRVFGAAAKKCICGSAECRGYIGGDPLNSDHIVQDDSDEEYLEPMMAFEDPQREVRTDRVNLDTVDISAKQPEDCDIKPDIGESMQDVVDVISIQHKEISPQHTDTLVKSFLVKPKLETTLEAVGGSCGSLPGVQQLEDSLQVPNITSKIVADAIVDAKSNSTIMTNEDNLHSPKPCASKKSSVPNGPVKKVRAGVTKFVSEKAKNILGGSSQSNNFDGVAKKLNELIGADGGIIKRKDAAKAYLKLLVVTAADNIGTETIQSQSTRDLSLILDALLKTKSRAVLMDILNKNGLQMLHNIMKQNRKNSNKIPILRKLLKVLKYLVENKILTQEQINMIPSCAGVESFQDSIFNLTCHCDKEVHHAAREFQEKWILRATRKANLSEMDGVHGSYDSHNMRSRWSLPSSKRSRHQVARADDAISCAAQTVHLPSAYFGFGAASETSAPSQESTNAIPSVHANLTIGMKPRKRKSRWDQDKPSEKIKSDRQCLGSTGNITAEASLELTKPDFTLQHENHSESRGLVRSIHRAANEHDSGQQDIDETPPGFGSPPGYTSFNSRCRQSDCGMPAVNGEVVIGKRQERYLSQLAVSHGIPLGLMQQLGTPVGQNNCFVSWIVAPGMPFHPFPPLPPYPRENKKSDDSPKECSSRAFNYSMMASGRTERSHSNRQCTAPCRSHVSRGIPCEVAESGAANLENNERGRQSSDVRERKLFMPQQCRIRGHKRSIPPWPRERSGSGSKGNRRHEMCNIDQGSLRKRIGASEGAIIGDAGTTSHQQKTHN